MLTCVNLWQRQQKCHLKHVRFIVATDTITIRRWFRTILAYVYHYEGDENQLPALQRIGSGSRGWGVMPSPQEIPLDVGMRELFMPTGLEHRSSTYSISNIQLKLLVLLCPGLTTCQLAVICSVFVLKSCADEFVLSRQSLKCSLQVCAD